MKTLYFTNTGQIVFDEEAKVAEPIESSREGISRIYLMKEPMNIVYNRGDKQYSASAEEGDVVIIFYENTFEYPVVVAKSTEWAENIRKYEEKQQREKEEWAKKHAEGCTDCCGDCPPKCDACSC